MSLLGCRVVRAPEVKWEGQENGRLGQVGTVVALGPPECPLGACKVIWDDKSGLYPALGQTYHCGLQGRFDLTILDLGPTGISHPATRCSECCFTPIFGIRWSCLKCPGLDLCSECYHNNGHDLTHSFIRRTSPGDPGELVGERANAYRTQTGGCFRDAKVERGPHWRWGDQDGGPGSVGYISEVVNSPENAQSRTVRSVVSVVWDSSQDNLYSRGHRGQVHVQAIQMSFGPLAFLTHLPALGKPSNPAVNPSKVEETVRKFQIGQQVMVAVDLDTLKRLQVGHGEFAPGMVECLGRKGRVHRITEKGLVRVQYPGNPPHQHRWAINPAVLRVVGGRYQAGDKITVTLDRERVEKFQSATPVLGVLGCRGTVTHVHSEASLVIDFGDGKVATLHPGCLEENGEGVGDNRGQIAAKLLRAAVQADHVAVDTLLRGGDSKGGVVVIPDNAAAVAALVAASTKGHLAVVINILQFRPNLVNEQTKEGRTALQVAAHEGHSNVVEQLLAAGADPGLADSAGDQAVHYAVLGNTSDTILTLVNRGANVNAGNKQKRTALHLAVVNRKSELVRTLLKAGADGGLQDNSGDSPLHLAVVQGDIASLALLLEGPHCLLTANGRGHNALHIAAVRGDSEAVRMILRRDPGVANMVTRDGEAALHLAATLPCLQALLEWPQCNLEIADGRGWTPLQGVAARLQGSRVVALVGAGASVGVQDLQGNTPAHLALLATPGLAGGEGEYSNSLEELVEPSMADSLARLGLPVPNTYQLAVATFLLKRGVDRRNNQGVSVFDLVRHPEAKALLKQVASSAPESPGLEHDYEVVDVEEPPELPDPSDQNLAQGLDELSIDRPEVGEEAKEREDVDECLVCSERLPLVTFLPCGDKIVCTDCSLKVKKCLKCKEQVLSKKIQGDIKAREQERLRVLEAKMQEIEDQMLCPICMERKRNMTFQCGHSGCEECIKPLDKCHMCRKPVDKPPIRQFNC